MDEMPGIRPPPGSPGSDGSERHFWRLLLSGSANLMAALDVRLRGAHGVTLRDVLLLELLSVPDRRAHRICVLAQTMGVSPGALTSAGYARLHAVLESHAHIGDRINGAD